MQRVVIPMVVFVRISPSERIPVLRLPSVSRFMVFAWRKYSGYHPGCSGGTFPLYAGLFGRSG